MSNNEVPELISTPLDPDVLRKMTLHEVEDLQTRILAAAHNWSIYVKIDTIVRELGEPDGNKMRSRFYADGALYIHHYQSIDMGGDTRHITYGGDEVFLTYDGHSQIAPGPWAVKFNAVYERALLSQHIKRNEQEEARKQKLISRLTGCSE